MTTVFNPAPVFANHVRFSVYQPLRSFWFSVLLICWVMAFAGMACADNGQSGVAAVSADIEVFVREGCPHCAKAKLFLQTLQQERPQLKIVARDIEKEAGALERLKTLAESQQVMARVPAFYLNGHLLVGYADDATTGKLLKDELAQKSAGKAASADSAGSCEAVDESLSCTGDNPAAPAPVPDYDLTLFGQRVSLTEVGLPLFTVTMGLLDGFNPCSMWVLILMISLLAPMRDRKRMLVVAGTFVAVEGLAYFVFMAAWLNLFLFIGLSRISQIIIAVIAIVAGAINLKDFWAFGWGVSLSIPQSAKPGIYARIRGILQAENLWGAMVGAVLLAVMVQMVEFLCTSGFPALYTRILTLRQTSGVGYYGYLLLYNLAYMLDDIIVLSVGVITLSQRRLQEKEGRWLKLVSGSVMVLLGVYLLFA